MAANAVTGANVVNGSLTQADIGDAPRLLSVEGDIHVLLPPDVNTVVVQIPFIAPAAGRVLLNTSGSLTFTSSMTLDSADCALTTGAVSTSPYAAIAIELSVGNLFQVPFGGTRTFSVAAGSSTTFKLVCFAHGGNVTVTTPVLTALFVAG